MSARFNVTRSSPDSQTYPPFAVQFNFEISKDRGQFYWSRSFSLADSPVPAKDLKILSYSGAPKKSCIVFLTSQNPDLSFDISERETRAGLLS